MKTALSTVIYKQAYPYLQDLLDSVDKQTSKEFDLLIINDNYTKEELEKVSTEINKTVKNFINELKTIENDISKTKVLG